jgi:hypothetical protein
VRSILLSAAIGLTLVSGAAAGNMGPHPVFGWNGNEYLFEVKPRGKVTHLTGYRAVGVQWQLVGTTTIRQGQKAPEAGWLQRVWFQGKRLGSVKADLSNPYWRRYPAEDRNGGGGPGIFF